MKLKISESFLLLVLIESASLSSAGKMVLNAITDSAEHRSLSQAVIEIIGSLEGDTPSATDVIKVTSHDVDVRNIDPFTETIVRSINGVLEFHIRDYDGKKAMPRTRHNAVLIVSKIMPIRRMEKILLSWSFESFERQKLLIVCLDEAFSPLKLMLDIMWRKFILNVHVVLLERNGDVSLNTYFPFTKDFCGQVHPVVWNIYRNSTFMLHREHFPRKNENLFRCALDVAIFDAAPYMIIRNESGAVDVDGVDGKLLKTLSNELNFTINYIIVSEDFRGGEIYANQTASGASELVRNNSE